MAEGCGVKEEEEREEKERREVEKSCSFVVVVKHVEFFFFFFFLPLDHSFIFFSVFFLSSLFPKPGSPSLALDTGASLVAIYG